MDNVRQGFLTMTDVAGREGRIVPFVFHRQGEQIRSMRRAWNSAIKRAGVPGAWIHDLRRTAVRNLERAGVSRSVAMNLTGHKTEAVYRRYAIADSAALAIRYRFDTATPSPGRKECHGGERAAGAPHEDSPSEHRTP